MQWWWCNWPRVRRDRGRAYSSPLVSVIHQHTPHSKLCTPSCLAYSYNFLWSTLLSTFLSQLFTSHIYSSHLTKQNKAALYFKEEFELSTEAAAAIASIFGWMNLFARGLGGFLSDISNAYRGMRGRLIWQFLCFALEGRLFEHLAPLLFLRF